MRKEGKYWLGTVEEIVKEVVGKCCFEWDRLAFPDFDFVLLDDVEVNELESNGNTLEYNMDNVFTHYYGVKFVNTGFSSTVITLIADVYGGSSMDCTDLWDEDYAEDDLTELIANVTDADGYRAKRDDYLLGMYV